MCISSLAVSQFLTVFICFLPLSGLKGESHMTALISVHPALWHLAGNQICVDLSVYALLRNDESCFLEKKKVSETCLICSSSFSQKKEK